jgi:hypothetical protein
MHDDVNVGRRLCVVVSIAFTDMLDNVHDNVNVGKQLHGSVLSMSKAPIA